jgi:diguanylate cyclase (GGDEF)-like protein
MSPATDYLTQPLDWHLQVLAAALCFLAAVSAFSLLSRAAAAGPVGGKSGPGQWGRNTWLAAASLTLGIGGWMAHVIAELDFAARWNLHHDLANAGLTVVLTVLITAIGFGLVLIRVSATSLRPPRAALLGGAIIGGGLAATHFAGLSALQIPGSVDFAKAGVMAGIACAVAGGAGAALIYQHRDDLLHRLAAALLLTLGLVGLHCLGQLAMSLRIDHAVQVDQTASAMALVSLAPQGLGVSLALATAILLLIGLAVALVDQHLVATHKREAERLRVSENRLRQLANATFEGIVLYRDGWIVDANAAICGMLGLEAKQMIGHHVLEVVADGSQVQVKKLLQAIGTAADDGIAAQIGSGGDKSGAIATGGSDAAEDEVFDGHAIEIDLRHADGRLVPVECLGRQLQDDDGRLRVVAVRDISERRAAEERIRHMANHDALTGLPNRTLFQDRLAQAVARSKRGAATAAVLCLDLDRFKNINDISGHDVGDELLRQVGERLANSVRADDTVARLSGDEFAVIQVGVAHPDGPAILADRLVKVLAQPFDIGGHQLVIGTSIGISLYPGDGEDDEELLRAADTALYRAKAAGRGTFRFFEAEMDVRLQERRHLERDLRQALATQQLDLHYQPLVDCLGIKVLGFEALVRWNHPERGFVSPADFIPLAEECGLITPLGTWVLRRACRDAMTWPGDTIVAVNLSPVQFRNTDIAREILGVLEETGLPPHRLELEITEGVLIDDTQRVLSILSELKSAGVRLSLDDFGTGYSSLSYLQRFPFDKIKIDRSFIWEMEKNRDSMAIVRAVIALGRSLRITVTAEGVETQQQLALLRTEHCDQAQGFLIGRPQPYAEASALLADPSHMMEKLQAAE